MVQSAGLLMYKREQGNFFCLLIHPGGPYFVKRNEGVWSIPKGVVNQGEALLVAAEREFFEETGIRPVSPYESIGSVKLPSGKIVHAWAFEGAWESSQGINSNTFEMEWPPKSGRQIVVAEADRAEWMDFTKASVMITKSQLPFLGRWMELMRQRV